MPNLKSSYKDMFKSQKQRKINLAQKTQLKNLIKKVLQTESKEDAQKAFTEAKSCLDRLASKKFIHKNFAARHKSRLYTAIKKRFG